MVETGGYALYTRPDYKSPYTWRGDFNDYRTASRMARHYKSKGYLTKICNH